jgi:hypothetical protein
MRGNFEAELELVAISLSKVVKLKRGVLYDQLRRCQPGLSRIIVVLSLTSVKKKFRPVFFFLTRAEDLPALHPRLEQI